MASLFRRAISKIFRITRKKTTRFRSPLSVAIVGTGGIGPDHILAYESTGKAQVKAVCDIRASPLASVLRKNRGIRAYRDFRQMLNEVNPDVVSICTWPDTHAEIALAAMDSGARGILCEKPVALNLQDISKMRRHSESTGAKLASGHQYRFHRNFIEARSIIQTGSLGGIKRLSGCIEGVLADNGPHLIDTARFLIGDPKADWVEGYCDRSKPQFQHGIGVEERASATIRFDTGVEFAFESGDNADEFFSITVVGESGTLKASPSTLTIDAKTILPSSGIPRDFRKSQFSEFLQWIKGRKENYKADFEVGAHAAELVLAIYESAHRKMRVRLPLENDGDVIGQLFEGQSRNPESTSICHDHPSEDTNRLAWNGGIPEVSGWFDTRPEVGLKEVKAIFSVLLSRQWNCSEGPVTGRLEQEFAKYCDVPHAVASTSGTAAIHLALGALGLNPGDEVITTPLSDMGTVIPILACNCIPVFADVDTESGNLTAQTIQQRITPRTRAVIVVHLAGMPADLEPIVELLNDRNIPLIEDCAQAHGAEYKGRKVGTFGTFGCFSLQQQKHVTCGDGGVTITKDSRLAERAALFSDKGWKRSAGQRNHYFLGMNYRITEFQSAIALAQLERLPRFLSLRRSRANQLTDLLKTIPGVLAPSCPSDITPSWWLYRFGLNTDILGVSREDFLGALQVEGVKANLGYIPKPLFEYDVVKYARTYGESGYPFTSFPYSPPQLHEFDGFRDFNEQICIFWSHRVGEKRIEEIASAVGKVANLFPRAKEPVSEAKPDEENAQDFEEVD